jgi:PAS domain S-box-containing protein
MKIDTSAEGISSRERFLEAIVQSAIDYAIISMDLDGLVTSWNEGACRILGWSAEEMIGRPATIFFTQEDRQHGIPQKEMTSALTRGRGSDERWHLRKDGITFWASGEMMALRTEGDEVIGFIKILRDKTEERDQADRQRLLMHELGHRVKNTLSVVQSIASQSLRGASSLEDASQKLHARISAYAKAHKILLQTDWVSARFGSVVEAAMTNIGMDGSNRIHWEGPNFELGPQTALSFSLVLHELLTNAHKYGALSNNDGRIDIEWKIETRDGVDVVVFSWRESGGPPVEEPARKGFGSRLIISSLQAYGEASISYGLQGLELQTVMPRRNIQFHADLADIDP